VDVNLKKYPNCFNAFQYSKDILSGKIISCWQIKAACERFERDLEDKRFYFDLDKAERALKLIQKFPHIKGPLANTPIDFEGWQLFLYANVFGFMWKHTKHRRFTKVLVLCARKNGKTAVSSGLGPYMMALDDEEGAEVFSIASKKDQARIVFDSAREQVNRSKSFLKSTGVETYRHHIEQAKTASVYKPLSSDSNSLDGLNPHCTIFDEVHSFKDRNIYGVMETAIGSRTQPILWAISTAGFDTTGICYELQTDLEKVLKQEYDDESQFGLIYTIDKEDDFRNEDIWIKANPNLDISVSREYIRGMVDKAIRQPGNKNNVMTKHFNVWCTASENLFDMLKWDECEDTSLKVEMFVGESAYCGIDLSSKIDLTAIISIFKRDNIYYIFDRTYLPEAAIENSMNASYKGWVDQGFITATKGEAINYPQIEEDFLETNRQYDVLEAFFDPWAASQFAQNMARNQIEMTEFRMNVGNVSEVLKALDALIREGRVRHNGSPVMKWCFSNVMAKEDHNSNIYFRKSHAKFKIDLAVATVLALAGWINEEQKESVYEDRGVLIL